MNKISAINLDCALLYTVGLLIVTITGVTFWLSVFKMNLHLFIEYFLFITSCIITIDVYNLKLGIRNKSFYVRHGHKISIGLLLASIVVGGF